MSTTMDFIWSENGDGRVRLHSPVHHGPVPARTVMLNPRKLTVTSDKEVIPPPPGPLTLHQVEEWMKKQPEGTKYTFSHLDQ